MKGSYYRAKSVDEVISLLQAGRGRARIIAGGTDLMLQLKKQQEEVESMIDISGVKELRGIKEEGDELLIGAAITHTGLEQSLAVKEYATALAEAASQIGSPQIRNLGTPGGNVVNAAPAADVAVALVALGAEAELIAPGKGMVRLPVEDLYRGVMESEVNSCRQLLTVFRLRKTKNGQASSFQRLSSRQALSLPTVNAAVFLSLRDKRVEELRLVAAPVGKGPLPLEKTAQRARGENFDQRLFSGLKHWAREEIEIRTSALRGSQDYREEMAVLLLGRALRQAGERIGVKI